MKKQYKIAFIVGVIVILAGVGIFSFVNKMISSKSIEISGILEANNTEIPSLVSGVIEKVIATEGQEVKPGSPIVEVNKTQLKIRKEQAESVVKQAEAQLEMIKSGASKPEIKQLQARVNQANANLQTIASGARPEEINQAQAKVNSAKVAYQIAEKDYESAKRLFEQDIIPKNKLDIAELAFNNAKSGLTAADETLKLLKKGAKQGQINVAKQELVASQAALSQMKAGARPSEIKVAQAQIKQAKSELQIVEEMIKDSVIKSPTTGTISKISANKGELITKGASIANIIDLNNIWVTIYIPESKLVYLSPNQEAKIYPESLKGIMFPGKITYIDQEGAFVPQGAKESKDQQVFKVKVKLDQSSKGNIQLRPGMTVKVKINIAERKKEISKSKSKK